MKAISKSAKTKKGNVGLLISLAIGIGILVFIIAIMASMLSSLQATQTVNSTAYNVSAKGVDAMKTFGDFFNVYVLAGVLVGIVALFGLIYKNKGGFS